MRAVATMAFGLVSAVGVCIVGASVASYVVAEPEHVSVRGNLAPDLWSVEPRRIEPSQQHYERLPPLLSSYALEERNRPQIKVTTIADASQTQKVEAEATVQVDNSRDQEWCAAKYRSYDPSTGTYKAFSGERRPCVTPQRVARSE